MRVRDGDGINAAELGDAIRRFLVDQRDAIPQDRAAGVPQQVGALADAERRPRLDAPEAWLQLLDVVLVRLCSPTAARSSRRAVCRRWCR